MRKIILLAAFVIPVAVQAQKSDKSKSIENVYAGVQWGADFNFLKNQGNSDNTIYHYDSRYSHTWGFEVLKGISDKIMIGSGIGFSRQSYTRTDECLTCDVEYSQFSTFYIRYTEVPVNVSYLFLNSKMDVLGTLGITNSFRRKVAQDIVAYKGNVETFNSVNDFTPYIIGMQLGFGFNYTVRHNLYWGMNVFYKQPFGKLSHDPALRFWTLTANTGFYYKF
jgi:hypothetical protein